MENASSPRAATWQGRGNRARCYRSGTIGGRGAWGIGMEGDNAERLLTNRRLLWLVIAAAVSALLMLFIADNFVLIEVRFFNRGIQMRLAWAILIPLCLGLSIGWLWGRYRR
jgi:uncharacterized integral membrane protein